MAQCSHSLQYVRCYFAGFYSNIENLVLWDKIIYFFVYPIDIQREISHNVTPKKLVYINQ